MPPTGRSRKSRWKGQRRSSKSANGKQKTTGESDHFRLEDLPNEVHEIILNKISVKDRFATMSVCKRWNHIVVEVNKKWKTLAIVRRIDFDKPSNCINMLCDFTSHYFDADSVIVLDSISGHVTPDDVIETICRLLAQFPQLIALHLETELVSEIEQTLLTHCPLLEHISTSNSPTSSIRSLPKSRITCVQDKYILDKDLFEFPNLKYLAKRPSSIKILKRLLSNGLLGLLPINYSYTEVAPNYVSRVIGEHGLHLRILGETARFSNNESKDVFSKLTQLKTFVYDGVSTRMPKITMANNLDTFMYTNSTAVFVDFIWKSDRLRKFLPFPQQLRSMTLRDIRLCPKCFTNTIAESCPNLEELNITLVRQSETKECPGNELLELTRLTKLRHLQINSRIDNQLDEIRNFLIQMPQLRIFNFSQTNFSKELRTQFPLITFNVPFI